MILLFCNRAGKNISLNSVFVYYYILSETNLIKQKPPDWRNQRFLNPIIQYISETPVSAAWNAILPSRLKTGHATVNSRDDIQTLSEMWYLFLICGGIVTWTERL